MTFPTVRTLIPKTWTKTRVGGHLMLWFQDGHTVDPTRNPGGDQNDPAYVEADCARLKKFGFDFIMPNCRRLGTFEDRSLALYMRYSGPAGLEIMPNVDCSIYRFAGSNPLAELQGYIAHLRKWLFPLSNYAKQDGKYVITIFTSGNDDPAWFRTVESENPDVLFYYDNPAKGPNVMAWVHPGLADTLDQVCATYANRADCSFMPNVAVGFNDGIKGYSCWNQPDPATGYKGEPARIYPAGIGPNLDTLYSYSAVLKKYYSETKQPPFIQFTTLTDYDEGTAMMPKTDGTGGWLAPLSTVQPAPTPAPAPAPTQLFKMSYGATGTETSVTVLSDGKIEIA